MEAFAVQARQYPDIRTETVTTATADGAEFVVHYCFKDGTQPGLAIVYAHGGAMIMGRVSHFHALIAQHVSGTCVPFLAVEYCKAPDQAKDRHQLNFTCNRGITHGFDNVSSALTERALADRFGGDPFAVKTDE